MRTFEVSPWNGNLKLFINFQFRPILKFDQPSGFCIPSLPQVDMTEGHAAGRFWGRILSRILGPNLESDSRDRILSRILGPNLESDSVGRILSRILGPNLESDSVDRILSRILGPNLESDSRDRILSRILGTESWVGFWGWILSRILGLNLWVGFWGRILSWILEPNLESDSGAEFLGLPGEDAPSVYCREGLYNAFFLCFENSKIVSLTNKIARGFLSNLGSCSYQKVFFFRWV